MVKIMKDESTEVLESSERDETNELQRKIIYTHDEAAKMIEMFEDILLKNDICIPSPEDDEREPDNMMGLYGSTYSDLLDNIEGLLIDIISLCKQGSEVVKYEFSGNY